MNRSDRVGPVSPAPAFPRSGDVLEVTRAASVQFQSPIIFRVIRVYDWPTYTGWVWLDGYQLNEAGEATERRSIFVQVDGLRQLPGPTLRSPRTPRPGRRNGAAASLPK